MDKHGSIASLHVHPPKAGDPLIALSTLTLVAGKGISEDTRYFGKKRRQVTLMEREQLDQHAVVLGLDEISPGAARSNIETTGIDLTSLVGRRVRIADAILEFYELRIPCAKMDAICQGLRELMEHGKQGVLATVVQGGTIRIGDVIVPCAE
jgi:MOSC domain-containing protein YiiM